MLFHDFLEALLRSWGREPKGTTVWQLLKEVLQNLPFGVKTEMVEIVPEQSVTKSTSWEDVHQNEMRDLVIEVNGDSNYLVKINDKDYMCKSEFVGGEDFYMIGDNETVPFSIEIYDNMSVVTWKQSLGETITLSIYEEREVVTPIDPKFVGASGGGGAFVVNFTQVGGNSVTSDKTLADVENALSKGLQVVGILSMKAGDTSVTSISQLVGVVSGQFASFAAVTAGTDSANIMHFKLESTGNTTFSTIALATT